MKAPLMTCLLLSVYFMNVTAINAQLSIESAKAVQAENVSTLDIEYQKSVDIYNTLLQKYVDEDGWVDYGELYRERGQLRDYINSLSHVDLSKMNKEDQLATYINAYNAFTLELILEYWNEGRLKSIFDIPENRRWDDVRWQIGRKTYSLNQIEHEQIRPVYKEPRIHFALVCAAYSCPILRNEIYRGDWLEKQLQQQTEYIHNHDRWYEYDPVTNIVKLTALYDWYGQDFGSNQNEILQFISNCRPEIAEAMADKRPPKIEWIEYDWRLNDVSNRPQK